MSGARVLGPVDAFISHASEDKEAIARPLAAELRRRGWSVWFDEFELTVGDSLRQEIDRGLATARFGIVILSKSFFMKSWPRRELDGLTAREISESEKVVLPVWHGVDHAYVKSFSPPLADKLAVDSSAGVAGVADAIERVLRRVPDAPTPIGPGRARGGRGAGRAANRRRWRLWLPLLALTALAVPVAAVVDDDRRRGDGVALDRDADGVVDVPVGEDCDPSDARTRPGATDAPENGLDEDCDGRDAEFPKLRAGMAMGYRVDRARGTTRLELLNATGLPSHATVAVRCTGSACVERSGTLRKARTGDGGDMSLLRLVGSRPVTRKGGSIELPAGTEVQVRVTKPGYTGIVRTILMRDGKDPLDREICLGPDDRPRSCPAGAEASS